jgi:hypothetical protein
MTPAGEIDIAYFSMEIAADPDWPTFAGGLGVLAGDFRRSAADRGLPIVGVTLLSRYGYFRLLSNRQDISVIGEASNLRETIQKTAELQPDLIILDVTMPEKDCIAPTKVGGLLNTAAAVVKPLGGPGHFG